MSEKIFATHFLRDEAQIKQDWLCLLMEDPNAPLDVTYKANLVKIQKEYYPVACYDVTCEADWNAISIWEHEEEYQVANEKIVYVDYRGEEHDRNGSDTEVYNGNLRHHNRRPETRTVYETKYRTVIDSTQPTSGVVEPTTFFENVYTGTGDIGDTILSWLSHINDRNIEETTTDYFSGSTLVEETISKSEAQATAENMADDGIYDIATERVPGNRYENFSTTSRTLEITRKTIYVGVYHIFYEYEGKKYDCLMCGGDETKDVILGDHPIDDAIKDRHEAIEENIRKNGFFSKRSLFLYGAIVLTMEVFSVIYGMINARPHNVGGPLYGGYPIVVKIILLVAFLLADAFCIYRYVSMKKAQKSAKAEQASFHESNEFLKRKIFELIQDDTIPEEGKRETIEGWINDQFGNLASSDQEKSKIQEEKKEKDKKIIYKVIIVAIGIIALSIFIFVAVPFIRYTGAINNIKNGKLVKGVETLKSMSGYRDADEYVKQYGSPKYDLSDDVWLRSCELIEHFSSEEFEKDYGKAVKEAIETDFGDKLSEVTIGEYAKSLTEVKIFKDYLDEIDNLKCTKSYDENYVQALKGYYFLVCDYVVAKEIEDTSSSRYYRFRIQVDNSDLGVNLESVLKEMYEKLKTCEKVYDVSEAGMYSIVSVLSDPNIGFDVNTLSYFGEQEEDGNEDDAISSDVPEIGGSTDLNAGETVNWYDFTELTGDIPSFYGIWCASSESKREALNIAQSMVNKGISGQVFYSENWSNLATGTGWYVVSAGSYTTDYDANSALSIVRQYYPSAYVEHSGVFIEFPGQNVFNPNNTPNNNAFDNNNPNWHIEELIYLASTRELTESDLEGYTSFELSAARNGIYAVYGYVFQTEEWNTFFSGFDWYIPNPAFNQNSVSSLETKNAGIIRNYEDAKYGGGYTFN